MLSNGPGDPKECTAKLLKRFNKLYEVMYRSLQSVLDISSWHWQRSGYAQDEIRTPWRKSSGEGFINRPCLHFFPEPRICCRYDTLDPKVAKPAFVNVNDGTNEGLEYIGKNIFTVQFHPEACPGPQDSAYLFDRFIKMMGGESIMPRNKRYQKSISNRFRSDRHRTGSEFDYAGTQACRSLKEEGVEVCLVNSNPATIMTDKQIADQVYIEPLTLRLLKKLF